MNGERKLFLTLAIGVPLMAAVFTIAICVGRYQVSLDALMGILSGNRAAYPTEWNVLVKLRIPRTIAALAVGIGLSVSGLLYQELFQNKLVSPDLLGVSDGAGVGAAVAILMGLSSWAITGLSFITGILAVLAAIAISRSVRSRSSATLLLSGIIVGGFAASVLGFVKYLAGPDTTLASIEFWLMGSCEYVNMDKALLLAGVITVCMAIIIPIKWRIYLISLGSEECRSRGINYNAYKWLIIGLATLMTAATVSVVGCVAWIGLVIPHIARMVVGRNTKFSIPLAAIFGGILMMVADIVSRCFTTSEIPLLVVMGMIGSVMFVIIMRLTGGRIDDRL